MVTYTYFVAHDIHDTDEEIDAWIAQLTEAFNKPGQPYRIAFHPGRNDFPPYGERQRRLGSWPAWQEDVVSGLLPMGEDRYIGIIRPTASLREPVVVGRGTVTLYKKLLALNRQRKQKGTTTKYALIWCHGAHDAHNKGKLVPVVDIGQWRTTGHRGADSKASAYLRFTCPECQGCAVTPPCMGCPGHVYGDEAPAELTARAQRAEAKGLNTQAMVSEGRVVQGARAAEARTFPAGPPPRAPRKRN